MKFKYLLIIFLIILIIISISQIFSIPPYEGDIYNAYKSGYFSEIEDNNSIIADSFTGIKMMSKPVYAWIFLEDIKKKYNIDIKVYNNKGVEKLAPGKPGREVDERVIRLINSLNTEIYSELLIGKYYSAIPILSEKKCRFCHGRNKKKIIGVLTFERGYNSIIYYTSERIVLFIVLSSILTFVLFIVLKWDPGRVGREMFDK